MNGLNKLCLAIDTLNKTLGRGIAWLVLATVLLSVFTAIARKIGFGSNGWLEGQWYLFSAVFLLGAAYTLQSDQHVRVDVLSKHWSAKTRAMIDIAGHLLFLLPVAIGLAWLGWQEFMQVWQHNEMSADAGGLPRWPVKLLIPVGFALLILQVLSEIGKRIIIIAKGEPT
ncbi:MAG: TRAP transporter small permease subunit [Moraxellaceae bacterium]|nr:TRAP transporter small permease subunit [Moraxellaceae bacterium]